MNKKVVKLVIVFIVLTFVIATLPPTNLLDYGIVGMRQGYMGGVEMWFDTNLDGTADIYSIFTWYNNKLVELAGAREYLHD